MSLIQPQKKKQVSAKISLLIEDLQKPAKFLPAASFSLLNNLEYRNLFARKSFLPDESRNNATQQICYLHNDLICSTHEIFSAYICSKWVKDRHFIIFPTVSYLCLRRTISVQTLKQSRLVVITPFQNFLLRVLSFKYVMTPILQTSRNNFLLKRRSDH